MDDGMECLICLFVVLVYDLITVHALERAIGVDAELILAFALFPHLALVNVLENIIFIVWLKCRLTVSNWEISCHFSLRC